MLKHLVRKLNLKLKQTRKQIKLINAYQKKLEQNKDRAGKLSKLKSNYRSETVSKR